jgi:hypothetical protein
MVTDFFEHTISQMVNVDNTLTAAEGKELQSVINNAKLSKTMAFATLGGLTGRILAAVDVVSLNLKDPNAKLVIGIQKDVAGKAAALIEVVEKMP